METDLYGMPAVQNVHRDILTQMILIDYHLGRKTGNQGRGAFGYYGEGIEDEKHNIDRHAGFRQKHSGSHPGKDSG